MNTTTYMLTFAGFAIICTVYLGFIVRLIIEGIYGIRVIFDGLIRFTVTLAFYVFVPVVTLYIIIFDKSLKLSHTERILYSIVSPLIGLNYIIQRLPRSYNVLVNQLRDIKPKCVAEYNDNKEIFKSLNDFISFLAQKQFTRRYL